MATTRLLPFQLLSFLALLLLPQALVAQTTPQEIIELFKPDRHVWHLEATIDRQGSGKKRSSKNGGRTTYSWEHEVLEVVTVHACGQAGAWAVSGVDWAFLDRERTEKNSVGDSIICPPPPKAMEHSQLYRQKNYPPDIRTPGDTRSQLMVNLTQPYGGQSGEVLIGQASAGLMEMPDGTAILSIRGQMLLERASSDLMEHHRVCEGDIVRKEMRVETCGPGCTTKLTVGTPAENGSQTTSQLLPPLPWLAGLGESIPFTKNSGQTLTGSRILSEQKATEEGGYQETTTADWKVNPVDPCEEVRALIEQDLAWTEAFLDDAIRAKAGADTNKLIELVVNRLRGDVPDNPELEEPILDMEVDKECKIEGEDAFRKNNRDNCKPRIITEALVAHELRHVSQCQKQQTDETELLWGQGTAARYGNNEADAHLVGINKALGWYEDQCPGEKATLRRRTVVAEKELARYRE